MKEKEEEKEKELKEQKAGEKVFVVLPSNNISMFFHCSGYNCHITGNNTLSSNATSHVARSLSPFRTIEFLRSGLLF